MKDRLLFPMGNQQISYKTYKITLHRKRNEPTETLENEPQDQGSDEQ